MTTTRFQPRDKVRVKSPALGAPVDLGLVANRTYTVSHVDDFGKVSLQGDARYFHPSHFELVMRAAEETYCLKDGDGDWWFFDAEDGHWYMVDGPLTRFSLFEGAEDINGQYGIDGTPTAPETYCLKDKDGDWWHSTDGENFRLWSWADRYTGTRTLDRIIDLHGIDAEPIPAVAGVTVYEPGNSTGNSTGPHLHFEAPAFQVGDHVEYIGGGKVQTERLIGQVGTVAEIGDEADDIRVDWDDRDAKPRGVLAENLRKVTANDPAPLQPGDWVKVLARVEQVYDNGSVRTQTFQSDGAPNGPRGFAIASAITRTDEVPEWAKETKPEEPTGLGAVVRVRHDVYEWARAVRTDVTGRLPWYYTDSSGNGGNRDWAHLDAVEVLSEGVEVTER